MAYPNMKLYYHKTDGGAEYLTDAFILCPDGHKEGSFDATYIVRIDGDITKDAELTIKPKPGKPTYEELLEFYLDNSPLND